MQQADDLIALISQNPPKGNQEDGILWENGSGYSSKKLQTLVQQSQTSEVDSLICRAWLNLAPPKVEFFLWLALLGKLNTKVLLMHKGIRFEGPPTCPFCSEHSETLDHLLMTCTRSWGIWCELAADFGVALESKETFKQFFGHWLEVPLTNKTQRKFWITSFFAVAWSLWRCRNEIVFQQQNVEDGVLRYLIRWRIAIWSKAWKEPLPYTAAEIARNFISIPELYN